MKVGQVSLFLSLYLHRLFLVKLHVTCELLKRVLVNSILVEPVVIPQSTIVEARQGSLVRLVCSVEAWPRAMVTWFFNDVEIYDPTRYMTEQSVSDRYKSVHVLEIRFVEKNQFGTYRCAAANDYGKNFAEIRLIEAPLLNMNSILLTEGSSLSKQSFPYITFNFVAFVVTVVQAFASIDYKIWSGVYSNSLQWSFETTNLFHFHRLVEGLIIPGSGTSNPDDEDSAGKTVDKNDLEMNAYLRRSRNEDEDIKVLDPEPDMTASKGMLFLNGFT